MTKFRNIDFSLQGRKVNGPGRSPVVLGSPDGLVRSHPRRRCQGPAPHRAHARPSGLRPEQHAAQLRRPGPVCPRQGSFVVRKKKLKKKILKKKHTDLAAQNQFELECLLV